MEKYISSNFFFFVLLKIKSSIIYEAHKLYLKLQEEVKEYLNESKQRLLKQLRSSLKTQIDALTFLTLLLDEYESLCQASKLLANVLKDLVIINSNQIDTHKIRCVLPNEAKICFILLYLKRKKNI